MMGEAGVGQDDAAVDGDDNDNDDNIHDEAGWWKWATTTEAAAATVSRTIRCKGQRVMAPFDGADRRDSYTQ